MDRDEVLSSLSNGRFVVVKGMVKWYDEAREFGFIDALDGGPDYLVEAEDLIGCGGRLSAGRIVEFDVTVVPKGPRALRVRAV
ncbi:cold-shock protein [Nocardia grenadensis]|uniref:cold-shock protein n=1 Tax=Nocardia grenadensis TaxID=931537 RepID=UPI0007A41134|nr:cold shock domain-containing protein [Nocardia grenadensis]